MALNSTLTLRLRLRLRHLLPFLAGLVGVVAPTWSEAQTYRRDPRTLIKRGGSLRPEPREEPPNATDLEGLYDREQSAYINPGDAVRGAKFRRRIPTATTSRFAPGFRDYLTAPDDGDFSDSPSHLPGRFGPRVLYEEDSTPDRDKVRERDRFSSQATTRFHDPESDVEPETRRETYLRYLKERDPARRAQLYRDYLDNKPQGGGGGGLSARAGSRAPLTSSFPPASAERPGFGNDRTGSPLQRDRTSAPTAAPRSSLFPSSRTPQSEGSPSLFGSREDSRGRSSTRGTAARRAPASRTTMPASPGQESSRRD